MGQAASSESAGTRRPGVGRWTGRALLALAFVVTLAITIPSMMASRIHPGEMHHVGHLNGYLAAQSVFVKNANYPARPGRLVYANPYTDLFEIGYRGQVKDETTALKLLDKSFADAHWDLPDTRPKAGYVFDDITADADGPYDFTRQCGLCMAPARYGRSGLSIFIIDVSGEIYRKDAKEVYPDLKTGDPVRPITVWPDVAKDGWTPCG
ncbi:MAG: hypothetical protein ACYS9X_29270 [Planctomycetota bacterium]|jgi:hypothetical protein